LLETIFILFFYYISEYEIISPRLRLQGSLSSLGNFFFKILETSPLAKVQTSNVVKIKFWKLACSSFN